MAFIVNSTTVLGDNYTFTADKQYLSSPTGFIQIGGFQGLVAGYTSGGFTPTALNTIDRFPFSTPFVTATDAGDLSQIRYSSSGQSSPSTGYTSGGITFPPLVRYNTIDRFPFSTPFTTATDAGDLSLIVDSAAGSSSETNGYSTGGERPGSPFIANTITRFPFSTPFVTSTDIGSLSVGARRHAGHSADSYGYTSAGNTPGFDTEITRFPFSTPFTTGTTVGNITQRRVYVTGQSSSTNGYTSGGYLTGGYYSPAVNTIDRFPFSTPFTTATDVGDLSLIRYGSVGQSSLTEGFTSGGFTPTALNTVDRFPFSTPFVTATDAGDLTQSRFYAAGQQY